MADLMCGLLTVGGGYAAQVNSMAPFSLDPAPLLDWGSRHGDPLDPCAAEAVVGLLALSGARRRTGLPEPVAELVKELMVVLLPLYVRPSRRTWPVTVPCWSRSSATRMRRAS